METAPRIGFFERYSWRRLLVGTVLYVVALLCVLSLTAAPHAAIPGAETLPELVRVPLLVVMHMYLAFMLYHETKRADERAERLRTLRSKFSFEGQRARIEMVDELRDEIEIYKGKDELIARDLGITLEELREKVGMVDDDLTDSQRKVVHELHDGMMDQSRAVVRRAALRAAGFVVAAGLVQILTPPAASFLFGPVPSVAAWSGSAAICLLIVGGLWLSVVTMELTERRGNYIYAVRAVRRHPTVTPPAA